MFFMQSCTTIQWKVQHNLWRNGFSHGIRHGSIIRLRLSKLGSIYEHTQEYWNKHTTARTNLLVGTKIYALHIACIETDLSLMNVFHLSLMIEKHDIQPFDIFPFCSLQSSSCRNWNDLTHIFFLNYQGIADEDFIFAAITIIVCFPNN